MNDYLEDLRLAIELEGYDDNYVKLCVGYAKRLLNNGLPIIFDVNHFSLVTGVSKEQINKMVYANEYYYTEAKIPKKSGGVRTLHIPSLELKQLQRWILDNILKHIEVSTYANGFCSNKSILDNAKAHVNKECVLNMDIKNFFPTIDFSRIFRVFFYYGYTKEMAFYLAKLCTHNGHLPQGSPASPYISNIISIRLDKRLSLLADKYEASYTRYADDITISGNAGIKKILPYAVKILNDEQFQVNEKKTRLQYPHQRQEVTGLLVNGERIRVNKHYKRELQQTIYYCMKFGVNDHLRKVKCNKAFYKEHLYGKAFFIHMVEPNVGKHFFELLDQIDWDY